MALTVLLAHHHQHSVLQEHLETEILTTTMNQFLVFHVMQQRTQQVIDQVSAYLVPQAMSVSERLWYPTH